MASYERTYRTARLVFRILEAVGWLVAITSIIVFVSGGLRLLENLSHVGGGGRFQSDAEIFSVFGKILGGAFFALIGMVSVAFVQSSRANVDQAEMTRDMLQFMRKSEGMTATGPLGPR